MTQVRDVYDVRCSDASLEKVWLTAGKQRVLRLAAQHRPVAQDDAVIGHQFHISQNQGNVGHS